MAGRLGGRGAMVAQHECERVSKVVGQRAAAGLVPDGQQEQQQQEQQQQQLQWERCAARLPEELAKASPPPSLQDKPRTCEWAQGC